MGQRPAGQWVRPPWVGVLPTLPKVVEEEADSEEGEREMVGQAAAAALMVFGSAIGPGITGALIDLGIDFPDQMIPIAAFYFVGALMAGLGILRYQRDLPSA